MIRGRKIRLAALLLALLMLLASCGGKGISIPLSAPGESSAARTENGNGEQAPPPEAPTETGAKTAKERVTEAPARGPTEVPESAGPIIEPQAIADYLFQHGELPENFITNAEAEALGWDSSWNYVSDVAPGKSIGGDRFGNYEKLLPVKKGVTYREADCNYRGGKRSAERIIYSSDGRVWYTKDHYQSFTEMKPSGAK